MRREMSNSLTRLRRFAEWESRISEPARFRSISSSRSWKFFHKAIADPITRISTLECYAQSPPTPTRQLVPATADLRSFFKTMASPSSSASCRSAPQAAAILVSRSVFNWLFVRRQSSYLRRLSSWLRPNDEPARLDRLLLRNCDEELRVNDLQITF